MAITPGSDILAEDLVHIRKLVCVADENLTAGQPVGISNGLSGLKVARAVRTSDTVDNGISAANVLNSNSQCAIGGDKFVFVQAQNSDDSLYATVGSIDTSTKEVTLGTPVAASTDIKSNLYGVCKLDTDKFIVFYSEDAATDTLWYRIGTVSGTTITFGAAAIFHTLPGGHSVQGQITCDFISTNKGIMFVGSSTTTGGRLIAFTAVGTVATAGTPASIGTTIDDDTSNNCVRKVDTDKFILACQSGYVQVGTLSGTTITLGSEVDFTAVSIGDNINIAVLSTSLVVVTFKDGSGTGRHTAASISGTTPAFGAMVSSNQHDQGVYVESATSYLVSNSQDSYFSRLTVSGTTITFVGVIIYTGTNDFLQFIAIENGYYLALNDAFKFYIQGMSGQFLGIAQTTVAKGANVEVVCEGIDEHQTGLIPGGRYQVIDGGLTRVPPITSDLPERQSVLAISATQVLV